MRHRLLEVGISLGLIVWTLVAFGDLLWGSYEFVNFDDHEYVVTNPQVHAGLTAQSVRWAFTTYHHFNWHPLTWVSLQFDHQIYGLSPRGYHVTNLLLHAANAALLFLFLRRSTGVVWPSAVVAAFFALHPIHVESVAWVTERKDVLGTFFWMLTLLTYVRYAECPGTGRYLLVLLCFALGLMSKPMLVTLPCVLLLLDYWPLRRWTGLHAAPNPLHPEEKVAPRFRPTSVRRLLLEKVPFFLLTALSCLLTIRAASSLIDVANRDVPFRLRLLNALVSYVAYLRQTVWPSDLAVLYPHPREGIPLAEGLAAGALLVCLTLLALALRRSRPYLLVGWLWYLGTLVPVIGLLQVADQARADRFTYVPLVGVFLAVCWGTAEAVKPWRVGRVALGVTAVALLVGCTLVTGSQLRHWRDSKSLWDRALRISGDDPRMHYWIANMHLKSGDTRLAIHHGEKMRELDPDNPKCHRVLALALLEADRPEEALQSMQREAALLPDSVEVRASMARVLWKRGRIPAAYEQLADVARLAPDSPQGQHYRGIVLYREGKFADAVNCLGTAARLALDNPRYHADLALALEDAGDRANAAALYRYTLNLDPRWPDTCALLAWILATHPEGSRRDGQEAIRWARMACSMAGVEHPPFLEPLAAAYAEAGSFERAVEVAQRGRQLARQANDPTLVARFDAALARYAKKQPFRDDAQTGRDR